MIFPIDIGAIESNGSALVQTEPMVASGCQINVYLSETNSTGIGYLLQPEKSLASSRESSAVDFDIWDAQKSIRFLNCCEETDYGFHIFEEPETHELVGITPAGRYHVRNCDLNAPHLIDERRERAKLLTLLTETPVRLKKPGWSLPAEAEALAEVVKKMIPPIPLLSGENLKKHRELKAALAELQKN